MSLQHKYTKIKCDGITTYYNFQKRSRLNYGHIKEKTLQRSLENVQKIKLTNKKRTTQNSQEINNIYDQETTYVFNVYKIGSDTEEKTEELSQ